MAEKEKEQQLQPPQQQKQQPGIESEMRPRPKAEDKKRQPSNKLIGQVALVTGGDSGIGKAVAILFAKEGADVAISYLNEHKDAKDTKQNVELYGRKCLLIAGDISKETFCNAIVKKTIAEYGRIDILVNNAAIHYECKK